VPVDDEPATDNMRATGNGFGALAHSFTVAECKIG
jgi:hypothetical protein